MSSNVIDFSARLARKRVEALSEDQIIAEASNEYLILMNWIEDRQRMNLLGFTSIPQLFLYLEDILNIQPIVHIRKADQLKLEMIMDRSPLIIADLKEMLARVRSYQDTWALFTTPRVEMLNIATAIIALEAELSLSIFTLGMMPEILTFPPSVQ
jgi:hypothetical protein